MGMGTTLTSEAVQQYQQQQGFQVKSNPEHGKILRKEGAHISLYFDEFLEYFLIN